jgi:hypothetical protein
MRIYRADRFAPPSKTGRRQVDPRLDTVALLLILIDLILLGIFAWKTAHALAAGSPPHRLMIQMAFISAIPSLVGLGLFGYMRGRAYIFALPLLAMSVVLLPGLNYACASYLARPFLPYTQIEYATRRTYTVGSTPVMLHVYPGSRDAVAPLVRILQDPQSPSRNAAVIDAGIVGPAAAEAVPLLSQILRERNRELSYQAGQSLVKIGGPGIDALIEALKADQDRVRLVAIVALQNAGAAGKPAIPELEKMWSKADPAMRSQIDIAVTNLRRTRNEL